MSDPGNNVFENNNQENTTPSPSSSPDDLLKSIVRDDGTPKYDNVEQAIKALEASQAHIKRLEEEKRTEREEIERLREQTKANKSVEDILDRLNSQQQSQKPQETPVDTGLIEEKARAIVEETLNRQQAESKAAENQRRVQETLISQFGDEGSAKAEIQKVCASLEMTPQELGELAKSKPNAVLAFFNSQNKSTPPTPAPLGSEVPSTPKGDEGLKPPEKSLLLGANSRELAEYMAKVKEQVYKKHGVTE